MRIDFNRLQEMTAPCMNNGTGEMSSRFYAGEGGKLISCRIHPGGAIGEHSHPTSDDLSFVLAGEGTAVCDGAEEPLSPGVCHVCKRGSRHSIRNTGEGDLVLLTVVVERGPGEGEPHDL